MANVYKIQYSKALPNGDRQTTVKFVITDTFVQATQTAAQGGNITAFGKIIAIVLQTDNDDILI